MTIAGNAGCTHVSDGQQIWIQTNAKNRLCRVSVSPAEPRSSIGALRAERCRRHLREKASGKSIKNRPELEKAIDELGTGDMLVLPNGTGPQGSMFDGMDIIKRVNDRGALVKVLDEPHLDLTSPSASGFIAFLSAPWREDEREPHPRALNDGRPLPRPRAPGSAASRSYRPPAGRGPQTPGRRRKLPIDRQDDGRAPRYGREAGWVGAARV